MQSNISSVLEFKRWWVLKSKVFGQESTSHQGKMFKKFLRVMRVCQKLGVILESKVVQKLGLEKKVFNKWWSPRLIFLHNFFFWKKSINFWHPKLTLKVRFWHFLTKHNSSMDFLKKILWWIMVPQKVPKSYFQSQFWMSKISRIFSKKKII